jgi:hypothetical protein
MAGTLTRLQMQTEVLDNLTQSAVMTTANNVTLADMANRWLDRAQNRIARMHNLIWAEYTTSTVASQKSYSFPDRMRSVKSMRLEDGLDSVKLTCVMPSKFDLYMPKPNEQTEDKPTLYVPYENTNTFELFRIPDTAYTLRIRSSFWPTPLATDGQTSDFTYLDDVIIAYATMYGYQWLQEMNDSKFWKAVGNDELKAQISAEIAKFPDWVPISEGFSAGDTLVSGEYYNNPFVMSSPNGYLE